MKTKALKQSKLSQKVLCSVLAASVLGFTNTVMAEVITAQVDAKNYSRVAGISGEYDASKNENSIIINGTELNINAEGSGYNNAIQARADSVLENGKYPSITLSSTGNIYASAAKETVVSGQDGVINLSSDEDIVLESKFTSNAFDDNKSLEENLTNTAYATVYARNIFGEGQVNISGKNVKILTQKNTMTGSNGQIKYGTAISGNGNGLVNIHGTDVVEIKGAIESYNQNMLSGSGESSIKININQDANDTAKVDIEGLYINAADASEINIRGAKDSSIKSNLVATANTGKSGGEIYVDFYEGGTLNGNVIAQNGGNITVKGANQDGYILVDGGNYTGTDLSLTVGKNNIHQDTNYESAVYVTNNAKAVFDGEKTEIIADTESTGAVVGVRVNNGGTVTFSADDTIISSSAVGSSGKWGYGLLVNGKTTGGQVVFNGGNVSISNYNKYYTSQTLTAKKGSTIDFNNKGDVTIKSESPFGVTAVDANGNITFNNKGNVNIIGTIVPGDKTGQTNVIGIQAGEQGTEFNVTNNVKNFNITLSGAGVDNDGTSYSSGTKAIYLQKDIIANINSETFNIDMNIASGIEPDTPGDHTSELAYGLFPDGGKINIGENTDTSITINEGLGTGYAVYANNKSVVNILGDTMIAVTGKNGAYALYADAYDTDEKNTGSNGGIINVGNGTSNISITGDVYAEDSAIINLNGDATFDGEKTVFTTQKDGTDIMGTINLAGGNMDGVLNIAEGSSVNLNGATFTADNISNDITGGGKVVLKDKGVLSTTAGQVFNKGDAAGNDAGGVNSTASKIDFVSGTLNLTDEEYTLDYVKDAKSDLNSLKYDNKNGTTSIVMSGTLISELGENTISVDDAASVGDGIALDQVTVEAGKNLLVGVADVADNTTVGSIEVGDSVNNGFNSGSLNLADGSTGVIITDGENVTLGGSNDGSVDGKQLVTVAGAVPSGDGVSVVVGLGANDKVEGVSKNAGSFTIGNALATSDTAYTLTGKVTVNADSELNVNGATTITGGVTLDNGALNVGNGILVSDITAKGNVEITGSADIGKLIVDEANGSSTVINVGSANATASTSISEANLNGATICFDPDWNQAAGTHGIVLENNSVDGFMLVTRNNYVGIGTNDENAAKEMFSKTGLTFGENDITAVLYIAGNQTLESGNAAIAVDGSKAGQTDFVGTVTAGSFTAADNSVVMVDGQSIKENAAVSGVTDVTIGGEAVLYVDGAKKGDTYKVLAGEGIDQGWAKENIISDNALLIFTGDTGANGESGSKFDVTASYDKINNVYGDNAVVIDSVVDKTLEVGKEGDAAFDFFNAAANSNNNATKDAQIAAFNSAANMGELAGVNHGTYSMSNAMTDAVAHHLSLATHGEQDKDIWAHYIHNKEDVDGMDFGGVDGSYDAQYNGIVVGSDLYKNGKVTAGVALSYADGNINGSNIASSTKNDAEYYGASLYGRIDNGDSAILGDISYMHSDNDITQNNSGHEITASADADAFSIGIRAEQAYKAGAGKFVPYAGIRYMHLGAGNYDNSLGMSYDADDQNLWLLPVGVTYSAEVQSGDWTVKPVAEVGYVWTMGDRDTDMTVSLNGAADSFGFETADSGSFIGRLGIEAEKSNVTYGLSYEYQKGDTVKANKWMVNLTYSF
ncbi:autotransporter domain-containing protein [Phascolarctobacterium faecium]|nr:autotransporter domain-containing protein [Phascolarctobacterium faecium]MDM8109386.1 autotransporter domain-containing protein [Phascolarctobacterium faecium]